MTRPTGQTTVPLSRLQPIRAVRIYTQVVDQILALVADGDLVAGDRLPPERMLAARMQVSRASLREALSALTVFGAIEVRHGTGIYISPTAKSVAGTADTVTQSAGPLEILEARGIWEPAVARLAAERRSSFDIIQIDALNSQLKQELSEGTEGWVADWGFHEALGRATQNPSIQRITSCFSDQMNGPIWALMRKQNLQRRARMPQYAKDHLKIFAAVVAGDPGGAETAMREHFEKILTDLES